MGDIRFAREYERLARAEDRMEVLRGFSDEQVIAALAHASGEHDAYLANVLASEAMNRVRRAGAIVGTAAEGLLSVDSLGRLTYANPAARRLLGWGSEAPLGSDLHALVHFDGDGRPITEEPCPAMQEILAGAKSQAYETILRRADGSLFDAFAGIAPILREGDPEGWVLTFLDITERRRAEEAFRRLAAVVEASQDAILLETPDGVILTWNEGAERIFGYAASEMVGRSVLAFLPPERHGDLDAMNARVARGEPMAPYETQRLRKDGSLVDVSLSLSPILDERGRVRQISAIYRDISERKRAEARLRTSEARFRTVVEQMPGIVYVAPAARPTEVSYVNPRIAGILGYPREVWFSEPGFWERCLHPDDRERVLAELARSAETREPFVTEYRLVARDGHPVWVQDTGDWAEGPDGPALHGVMVDVTDRKRAEADLRASEARYRLLAEQAPDLVLTLTPDGVITYASPASERVLGYAPGELVGQDCLGLVHPDDVDLILAGLAEAPEDTQAGTFTVRERRKDGEYAVVDITARAVRDPETGDLCQIISVVRDLSGRAWLRGAAFQAG